MNPFHKLYYDNYHKVDISSKAARIAFMKRIAMVNIEKSIENAAQQGYVGFLWIKLREIPIGCHDTELISKLFRCLIANSITLPPLELLNIRDIIYVAFKPESFAIYEGKLLYPPLTYFDENVPSAIYNNYDNDNRDNCNIANIEQLIDEIDAERLKISSKLSFYKIFGVK
jgi:hypothetical protein